MKKLLTIVTFLVLFSAQAWATSYYVDFTPGVGNDSNNGTATGTPFKHCPGDSNATGTAASTSLVSGDTVIFKGGVTYTTPAAGIVVTSGTTGNVVNYDGNSAGTWGTGRAIITGAKDGNGNGVNNSYGFYADGKDYYTINNFEIYQIGSYQSTSPDWHTLGACTNGGGGYDYSTLPAITGIGIWVNSKYATVENCYFHEIGIWQNEAPVSGDYDISGEGIRVYGGSHITIDSNEFTKMSYPVRIVAATNNITYITVSNNNIHSYVRWGISAGPGSNMTLQDIDIYGNTIHDFKEYAPTTFNPPGPSTVCGNAYGGFPHVDSIIWLIGTNGPSYDATYVTLGTPTHPNKIHHNKFYFDSIYGGQSGAVFLTGFGGTVWIYDNTFANTLSDASIYVQDGTSAADNNPVIDYHIYNNTFYDICRNISLRSLTVGFELDRTGYTLDIRNNIFYFDNTSLSGVSAVGIGTDNGSTQHSFPTTLDYNRYYVNTGYGNDYAVNASTGSGIQYYPFASIPNLDSNFEVHGTSGLPPFVNITYGLGAQTSSNDLHLTSATNLTGVSLSSYFTTDLDGVTRSAWDVGAYEYIGPNKPENPIQPTVSSGGGGGGGGSCFIATATYGSYLDPHVKVLRNFRDRYLLMNPIGSAFVYFYYKHSPPVADFIAHHETMRVAVRWGLTPVVYAIEYPSVLRVVFFIPIVIFIIRRKYSKTD
jgi:hypothetical protein